MIEMPYFMTNDKWYYFDGKRFVPTKDAPDEAKKSIEDFYKAEEFILYGRK